MEAKIQQQMPLSSQIRALHALFLANEEMFSWQCSDDPLKFCEIEAVKKQIVDPTVERLLPYLKTPELGKELKSVALSLSMGMGTYGSGHFSQEYADFRRVGESGDVSSFSRFLINESGEKTPTSQLLARARLPRR